MKLFKRTLPFILAGLLFLGGIFAGANVNKVPAEAREEIKITKQIETDRQEIDLQKIIDQANVEKAQNFIKSVNTKVEIKCLNLSSSYRITFDNKNANKFTEWLADSKLHLQLDYHTSIDFPVDKINMSIDQKGNVTVSYDEDYLKCNGIVVDRYSYTEDKHLFAKERTKDQLIGCIELASEKVTNYINEDLELLRQANKGLEGYLKDMARGLGVRSISFENSGYSETLNVSNFQQGE